MSIKSKLEKAKRFAVTGSLLKHVYGYCKYLVTRFFHKIDQGISFFAKRLVLLRLPIDEHKIFVMTYDDSFTCNPQYIVSELIRQGAPVDIVWVVPSKGHIPEEAFPEEVRLVRRGSYSMYEEMATAKVWLDNALNCLWYGVPKKKGQIYINTWHGSMGIKKLHGDRYWLKKAAKCNKFTDYCITNSRFEEDVFRGSFWPDVPLLKYGHARNDILFDRDAYPVLRQKICEYFQIEEDTKVLLYAPTFRDNGDMSWFDIDFDRLLAQVEARFGGRWVVLIRMHYKNRKKISKRFPFTETILDASSYGDMQELMAAADAGITDYSSWAYDFVLTRRPLFIYAPDVEEYDQERGFYYPLNTVPFPVAYDAETLLEKISSFDAESYAENVEHFLEDKGCYEDGHASERAAGFIRRCTGAGDVPEGET